MEWDESEWYKEIHKNFKDTNSLIGVTDRHELSNELVSVMFVVESVDTEDLKFLDMIGSKYGLRFIMGVVGDGEEKELGILVMKIVKAKEL
jgi:hypothetical protein